jgi:hypothetical protein
MAWDGWFSGSLAFPAKGVERWKKLQLSPVSPAGWPAWIAPPRSAVFGVATCLKQCASWKASWEKDLHVPEAVRLDVSPRSAELRGYLTGAWWRDIAGTVAAAARVASEAGGAGEVLFVEVRSSRGHLLTVDPARGARVEPVDLTESAALRERADDSLAWIRGHASQVPDPKERHTDRDEAAIEAGLYGTSVWQPPHPFREVHAAAGGSCPVDSFAIPTHRGGVEAETERIRTSFGVLDRSHRSDMRVSGAGAVPFLCELAGEGLDLGPGKYAYTTLRDPDGAPFDDVVLFSPTRTSVLVYGTPGNAFALYAWLRVRGAEAKAKKRHLVVVEMPSLYGSRWLTVVGPGAPDAIEAASGKTPASADVASVAQLGAELFFATRAFGFEAYDLLGNVVGLRPLAERWRDHLCGSAAEDALAGRAPGDLDFPRWSGA